jgi:hypothetical protein
MRITGAAPATPSHIVPYGRNNAQPQLRQGGVKQAQNLDYSNIYKWYNNWNFSFVCGFDMEDILDLDAARAARFAGPAAVSDDKGENR